MKRCTKCKKEKNYSDFSKNKNTEDGLSYRCKLCDKEYRIVNKNKISICNKVYREGNREKTLKYSKNYYRNNKIKMNEQTKQYRINNKEKTSEYNKTYRKNNKKKLAKYIKQYQKDNKEELADYIKQYYLNNKKHLDKKSKLYGENNKEKISSNKNQYRKSNAKYYPYKDKLTIEESPRLAKDNKSLEVKCRYCGKYFMPTNSQVIHRISAINGITTSENLLYCSAGCKEYCPIYGQILYPKGFKPASSREVNPLVRQMCFERDNWRCQICGATQEEAPLHCHHIEGYAQNPRLGNDVTNTITLCKTCHKDVHKLPGCWYYELRCNNKGAINEN